MRDRSTIFTFARGHGRGPAPRWRSGSVYLLALGASTLIAIIGLTALTKVRINQRMERQAGTRATAQLLAMSAVEHALAVIDGSPQWRMLLKHDVESPEVNIGDGAFTWALIVESGGDLSDDESEPVRLRGTGRSGESVQMYSVQLMPVKTPLTCLESCLHGNGTISFNGANVQADRPVSTNWSMDATSANVDAPVQAVTDITGATYSGTREVGIAAKELPDAASAFDYYLNQGTQISIASLPLDGSGFRVLERMAIGDRKNPLGLTNPEGIYVVRCNGAPIIIRTCRIIGTIVLLEPGPGSRIEGSVNWSPAVPTYPAMMVRGSMDVRMSSSPLSESSGGSNVNYNPPGMPYNGSEDLDTSDSFPSVIRGLVYMTETLSNSTNEINVQGMIVVGETTNLAGTLNVKYRQDIYQNAPPGFYYMNKVVVVPKSWQQDVR